MRAVIVRWQRTGRTVTAQATVSEAVETSRSIAVERLRDESGERMLFVRIDREETKHLLK